MLSIEQINQCYDKINDKLQELIAENQLVRTAALIENSLPDEPLYEPTGSLPTDNNFQPPPPIPCWNCEELRRQNNRLREELHLGNGRVTREVINNACRLLRETFIGEDK